MKQKILVLLGPTATGKSDSAVKLARWIAKKKMAGYDGAEIISADSRQVYRGLNIGTGKITKKEMQGVPHYLLDVADPRRQFTVIDYKKLAEKAIKEMRSRGKLPIICGGSAFYIDAVVNGTVFPATGADKELRERLAGKSAEQLFKMLEKLDPKRTHSMNESDRQNPRRLIRAIEIAQALKQIKMEERRALDNQSAFSTRPMRAQKPSLQDNYDVIFIGLKVSPTELRKRIRTRLIKRLKHGMIAEAHRLHSPPPRGAGLPWKRMEELGLEYRYLARFLQGKITHDEMIAKLETEIWRFSKRQMTWWRRNGKIRWFESNNVVGIKRFFRTIVGYSGQAIGI